MDKVMKFHNKVDNFLALIAGITIFVMMMLIFLDVTLRFIFNSPIIGVMEITGEYLMVVIVYFSISYTQKERGHVHVEIFGDKLSPKWIKIFSITTNVIGLCIFIILGIANFTMFLDYLSNDIRSRGILNYELWPALLVISLGILSLCTRLFIDTINLFRNSDNANEEKK